MNLVWSQYSIMKKYIVHPSIQEHILCVSVWVHVLGAGNRKVNRIKILALEVW